MTAPPTVPRTLPPVRTDPATAPTPAPTAVLRSWLLIPAQAAKLEAINKMADPEISDLKKFIVLIPWKLKS